MTTNMAEVLKLAARPTPYDNDERTWLEIRFKLENYLTLVNEKFVAPLPDAETQPVANAPAGTDESSVLIRTLSHTLYASNGDSWWRKTHQRQRVEDSQCCKL